MKNLVNDLVVTRNETTDTPEIGPINHSNGVNYWLIDVILLAIACLLLLMATVVKYYIKRGLTIAYFLHISIIIKDLVVQWFF